MMWNAKSNVANPEFSIELEKCMFANYNIGEFKRD